MSGETQAGGTTAPAVETRDASAGRVALLLAGLIGALLLVCAGVAGMLLLFTHHAPREAPPSPAALHPPEPRLQADETIQRRRLQADAETTRPAIDAAMARVARHGWPEGKR